MRIVNALIFDGSSVELTEGGIRIVGGEIVEIGEVKASSDEPTYDAASHTIILGLIDAHFRVWAICLRTDVIEMTSLSHIALAASHRLKSALRRGFTTVRDVAGDDPGLASAIAAGLIPSARYLYTGAALSQTGVSGDSRSAQFDRCHHGGNTCEVVDGEDDLRHAARERFRRGARAIKMMTSGGVISHDDPIRLVQYPSGEIRAVVEEADRRGSYVAAHAYSPEAIRRAVDNGIRSIEHGNLLDDEVDALMSAKGAYLVPTLVAYDAMDRRGPELRPSSVSPPKNRNVLYAGGDAIVRARSAGVAIGFGTDLVRESEDEQLIGLQLQSEGDGILNALRSATTVDADLIGRPELGRIAVGAVGDLVILDGNLFDRPEVFWDERKICTVIQGERLVA